jgi:hypothetical protein
MQVWSCEEIERKKNKDISKKRRINIGALLIQGTSCHKKEWKFYAWMEWQLFKVPSYYYFLSVMLHFQCTKLYIYFNSIHHLTINLAANNNIQLIIINHFRCLFIAQKFLFFTSPFYRPTLEPKVLLLFYFVIFIKKYRSSFCDSKFATVISSKPFFVQNWIFETSKS